MNMQVLAYSKISVCIVSKENDTEKIPSPNRLISQSVTCKEWSVQGSKRGKHKTYSPLDDHLFILTTSKAFHYFQARRDENRIKVCFQLMIILKFFI